MGFHRRHTVRPSLKDHGPRRTVLGRFATDRAAQKSQNRLTVWNWSRCNVQHPLVGCQCAYASFSVVQQQSAHHIRGHMPPSKTLGMSPCSSFLGRVSLMGWGRIPQRHQQAGRLADLLPPDLLRGHDGRLGLRMLSLPLRASVGGLHGLQSLRARGCCGDGGGGRGV